MKNLLTGACCFFIFSSSVSAQKKIPVNEPDQHRSRVFNDLPSNIAVRKIALEQGLSRTQGEFIDFQIADNFRISGTVVSTANDEQSHSVVVRLKDRENMVFTLSKVTDRDGSTIYRGRITGKAGDAYDLVKDGDGYAFKKFNYYELISE